MRDDFGLKIFVSDCPTVEPDEEGGGGGEGMGWVTSSSQAAKAIDELEFGQCFEDGGHGAVLCFGNERRGCSQRLIESACESFYLPMCGFTQSFNIGVALGMSLTAVLMSGHFAEGTLSDDERAELLGRWLLRDIKASRSLLEQAGLEFDDF